jgi:uncharacterized RDD family membrane protein YckC
MVKKDKYNNTEQLFVKTAAKLEALVDLPRQKALRRKERRAREIPYATFNDRVFASVIDTAISFILLGPILMATSSIIYGAERANPLEGIPANVTIGEMLAQLQKTHFLGNLMMDYLVHFVVFGIIIIWFWNRAACTPGKWLLKMRLVDSKTFCKPSPKQLMVRYMGYMVSLLPLTLGFAWIMVDKRGRAWHDMMADTVVVKVKHWRFKDDGKTAHIERPIAISAPETE